MAREPLMIDIVNLSKRFGRREVLRDISLGVPKGNVLALIGPSGSGKSTLLRCVNLLEAPDSGSVTIDSHTMRFGATASRHRTGAMAAFRAEAGMVFQSFNLFPHLTVLENVMSGPRFVRGQSRDAAERIARPLLERMGMESFADTMPERLSGGQKQRVAIARALAMEPKVMLFDEATSALDPQRVAEILSVMRDLAQAGMTQIVVTHEMSYARDVADTVVFMADGYIVESGPARQVIEDPREERTRTFLKHFHMGKA
ncbi:MULTISPECIES: amino acid ABC transporter ATP-binding protein [Nguyenibacter]|nr:MULTISPECIES: amino acid ABC transporter ATP-binding protein [Nguyenibacter]WRH89120.1 amino acid ABC transporter ATP-binding protein [Nguyenibacter sp. L1]